MASIRDERVTHVVVKVHASCGDDSDGGCLSLPFNTLLPCVAELRDLYMLSHRKVVTGAVSASLPAERWASVSTCEPPASWMAVKQWALQRSVRTTDPAARSWLDDADAADAYAVSWQLKRFVGGFDSCAAEGLFVLRSGSSAFSPAPSVTADVANADDDLLFHYKGVQLLEAAAKGEVDTRVWELLLASTGNWDDLLAFPADIGGATTSRKVGLGAVPLPVAARPVLATDFGAGDFIGPSSGCQAALGTLSPFEIILWFGRYYALIAHVDVVMRHGGRRKTVLDFEWVSSVVGHVRYAVQRVVAGWNALARRAGFQDVEAMVAPYILWSSSDVAFAPLSRPADHGAVYAPSIQRWSLYRKRVGGAPSLSAGAADPAAGRRLPHADAQLRAAASMFITHLVQATSVDSITELVSDGGAASTSAGTSSGVGLGRLSVRHYRPPAWRRSTGRCPRILHAVIGGLSAVDPGGPMRSGGRVHDEGWASSDSDEEEGAGGGRPEEADDDSDAGDIRAVVWRPTSLEMWRLRRRAAERAAGRDAAARSMSAGGRSRAADECGDGAAAAAEEAVAVANGIIDWAATSVYRVYKCRAEDLVTTHAVAEAESKAKAATQLAALGLSGSPSLRRWIPPGLVVDLLAAEDGNDDYKSATTGMASALPDAVLSRGACLEPWPALAGSLQLMLMDPPFSTRRLAGNPHAIHDVLTVDDARSAVEICRVLLRPGGHVLVYGAWSQVNLWVDFFRGSVDHVPGGSSSGVRGKGKQSRKSSSTPAGAASASSLQTQAAFIVSSHPLYALRGVHGRLPRGRTNVMLSNMSELIICATRAGAAAHHAHMMVNYQVFGCVPSRYRAYDNVIDNVPDLPAPETVYIQDEHGDMVKLRPEQKSVALNTELVQRNSQPGALVCDAFCGTGSTGEAALSVPGGLFRRVILCDAFADAVTASRQRLRRTFVEQVLMGGFARHFGAVAEQVRAAAHIVRQAETDPDGRWTAVHGARGVAPARLMARPGPATARQTPAAYEPPAGLPAHSALPLSILTFLANVLGEESDNRRRLLGGGAHPRSPPCGRDVGMAVVGLGMRPFESWPISLRCDLSTVDTLAVRQHGAAAAGFFIANSLVAGGQAGLGLFAARELPRGALVGPFFGALMYSNFGAVRVKSALYSVKMLGALAPSPAEFVARAVQLGDVRVAAPVADVAASQVDDDVDMCETADDGGGTSVATHRVWICPSPFCWAALANDPRPTSATDRAVLEAGARERGAPGVGSRRTREESSVGGGSVVGGGVGGAAGGGDCGQGSGQGGSSGTQGTARLPNVRFELRREDGVVPFSELVNPSFCQIVTTRHVGVGDELLLDYGPEYQFGGDAVAPGMAKKPRRDGGGSTTPHTFASTVV